MDIRPRRTDNPVARFWDRYIESIHNQGIKPPTDRWYVRHSEQYITSYADKKLTSHTPVDVTNYLEKLGRNTSITDWQFSQTVDAIQNLFRLIRVAWLDQVDWHYWKKMSRELAPNHATLAKEGPLTVSRNVKGSCKGVLAAVQHTHAAVFKALTAQLLHPDGGGLFPLGLPVYPVFRQSLPKIDGHGRSRGVSGTSGKPIRCAPIDRMC